VGKSFVIKGAGILALFLVGYSLTSYLWVGLLLMSSFSILSTVFFDIFITRKIKRFSLNKRLKDSFSLAKETLPLCLYLFLSAAIATVPKLLLERHSGEEILGIYSSIFAPAILIQAALGYIYTPFTPALSEYRMKSQTKKFIVLALKITAAICIFTVVMIGFASIFGEFALSLLFGDEIRPYSYLLLPILIAISAISILAFLCMIAIVLRSIPSLIIGTAIGFASTLIITVPMINKFGINGTSYSLIVSALIASAVLVISIVFKLYTEVKKTPKIQERD
jgi:O-antigen/teichoic acid export membrane protein